MKKKSKQQVIALLFLGVLTSFSFTYAYWQGSVLADDNDVAGDIKIGEWDYLDDETNKRPDNIPEYSDVNNPDNNSYVYYDGEYYVIRFSTNGAGAPGSDIGGYGPYNMVGYEYNAVNTYVIGSVVYYEGNFYKGTKRDGNITGISRSPDVSALGCWTNMTSINFVTNQVYNSGDYTVYNGTIYQTNGTSQTNNVTNTPDKNVYWKPVGDMNFVLGDYYYPGDIVLASNGKYYSCLKEGVAAVNPINDKNSKSWKAITTYTYSAGTTYTNGSIVIFNNHQYKVMDSTKTSSNAPGTSAGVYKELDTQSWVMNNYYAIGEVVEYQGNYYRCMNVANAETNAPGKVKNSWNLLNTSEYIPTNTYQVGDYVMYQGSAYYVYDATNANLYAPNSHADAWNIYGTLNYNQYTHYTLTTKIGDITTSTVVVYSNVAYQVVSESCGAYPPLRPNSTNQYWEEYEA
jgi:hypothetical protein